VMERYRKHAYSPSRICEPVALYAYGNRATQEQRLEPAAPSAAAVRWIPQP
jgi:hypothetical protein